MDELWSKIILYSSTKLERWLLRTSEETNKRERQVEEAHLFERSFHHKSMSQYPSQDMKTVKALWKGMKIDSFAARILVLQLEDQLMDSACCYGNVEKENECN